MSVFTARWCCSPSLFTSYTSIHSQENLKDSILRVIYKNSVVFPESATQPLAYYFDALLFIALKKGCLLWGSCWKWNKSLGLAPSCPCLSFGLPEADVIWTHGNLLFQWDSLKCPLLGCPGPQFTSQGDWVAMALCGRTRFPGGTGSHRSISAGRWRSGPKRMTPSHWFFCCCCLVPFP